MLMHIYRMLKIIHKVENWEKKKKKRQRDGSVDIPN